MDASSSTTSPPARDGRDVRWEAHRVRRRRQLVEAALKAIRAHGAGVGMDEIAAQAGTSKTVLYRHLGDRAGVYQAVVAAVDELILGDLEQARSGDGAADVVEQIGAMARAYLQRVDRDPEIYRFVMTRPLETSESDPADPVHRITDRIGEQLSDAVADHLVRQGRGAEAATLGRVWGHGLVGFVKQAADHRACHRASTDPPLDVDDITRAVIDLVAPALRGATTAAAPQTTPNDGGRA